MTVPSLTSPVITYVLGDENDPSTWVSADVQTLNVDQLAYERQAVKSGWKGMETMPFLWMTFLAWHALKRRGVLTCTMEEWPVLSVTADTTTTATPTQPAAG